MSEIKQTQMNFFAVDAKTKQIPIFVEKTISGKSWLSYGSDNLYPNYLWNLYLRSAVMQSIINGIVDYVVGKKIEYNENIGIYGDEINNDGESIEDVVKKLVNDYMIFDGFAIQIIYNNGGEVSELYALDFIKCRVDEDITKVFYCNDWKHPKNVLEYDVFDTNHRHGSQILYFNGHHTRGTYPIPRYSGAITAIETSTEISNFHLNELLNGFTSSAIINFNNGIPTDEVKAVIEKQIKEKFTGSENAGRFLVSWNDGKDNSATIERLSEDNFDERYSALRNDTYKEIFIAFRAPGQLFNFTIDNGLFNRDEYDQAFALFNSTVIIPIQKDFIRVFNKIFNMDNAIQFVPLEPFKSDDINTETVN